MITKSKTGLIARVVAVALSTLMFAGSMVTNVSADCTVTTLKEQNAINNTYGVGGMTRRWASPIKHNINDKDESTFEIVEPVGDDSNTINIITCDKSTGKQLSIKTIDQELPIFGGFYAGKDYNFLIVGQNNEKQDDNLTTVKVIKYTKDWKRVGSVDWKNNNTVYPFDAGSARCAEIDGYLFLHTCHEMYNGHQANMSMSVRISDMQIVDQTSEVTYLSFAYTSHSFNQYIKADGKKLVAIDHGDAYERGIVITKTPFEVKNGAFIPTGSIYFGGMQSTQCVIDVIPGDIGANCTGLFISGFEVGKDNYLVAASSIDRDKVKNYTSFKMEGLDKEERNVYIYTVDRDFDVALDPNNYTNGNYEDHFAATEGMFNCIELTDYFGNNKICSDPYLVKINDNKFAVIWEEFNILSEQFGTNYGWESKFESAGVVYCVIDNTGKKLIDNTRISGAMMPMNHQPVYMNNKLVWYVNKHNDTKLIYMLDVDGKDISVTDIGSSSKPSEPTEFKSDLPFTDVDSNGLYYIPIKWVYTNKLFQGTSETTFEPLTTMTRAMFVTVIGRHAGVDVSEYTNVSFDDVKANSWYAPYVEWASKEGIVQGYGNGLFGVDDKITIEQAVVMLGRYAEYRGILNFEDVQYAILSSHKDADKVSDWAKDYMAWAISESVYYPEGDGWNLLPKNEASRQLVASLFYHLPPVLN